MSIDLKRFPNLAGVAGRYLAVQLMPAGCVAEDPRVARAHELSRCAVEAFPATAAAMFAISCLVCCDAMITVLS